MAIVNITPDSFYDGGKYESTRDILADVEEKLKLGATIIDIGAASSRPGAAQINEEEEWKRLQPVLPEIRRSFPQAIISIDTFRSEIARRSAGEGADIINDVGGGTLDPKMFETVAQLDLPYVLTHIQGTPQTMQQKPAYNDVLKEVYFELTKKLRTLAGLDFSKVILDPGFGFGKTTEHNYTLLKNLHEFASTRLPVLAGLSRKRMINHVIGTNPVTALNGTTVLHTIALLNGAHILRVHDVTEAKQVIELVEYYKNV